MVANRFIVDGIQYPCIPSSMSRQSGVRVQTRLPISRRQRQWHLPLRYDANNPFAASGFEYNHEKNGVYALGWEEDGHMDAELYDHLMTLFTSRKAFWLVFDDHMSRECGTLFSINDTRTVFIAATNPTYPTTFPNHITADWDDMITIDGVPLSSTAITVDVDIDAGVFTFSEPISTWSKIKVSYVWACPVVILDFKVQVMDQAYFTYVGSMTVKRIPSTNMAIPWLPAITPTSVTNSSEFTP